MYYVKPHHRVYILINKLINVFTIHCIILAIIYIILIAGNTVLIVSFCTQTM